MLQKIYKTVNIYNYNKTVNSKKGVLNKNYCRESKRTTKLKINIYIYCNKFVLLLI